MTNYLIALAYRDGADDHVGFVLVEVAGNSAEEASRAVERHKVDLEWLLGAFRARDPQDLDGIIVGDHLVIAVVDHSNQAAPKP